MNKLRLSDQCEELQAAVRDETVTLIYGQANRDYAVIVADMYQEFPYMGYPLEIGFMHCNDAIYFCPWSGCALPGNLRDQRIKVIEKELDIAYSGSLDETILTPELLTEEWWLKRNIGRANDVLRVDWMKPELVDQHITIRAINPVPGLRRYGELSPHMCATMARKLSDVGVMIAYLPHTREYGFRVVDPQEPVDFQPIRIRAFRYCPWCGDALPESLGPEWEARVTSLGFGTDAMDHPEEPPDGFPAELASDFWWRQEDKTAVA